MKPIIESVLLTTSLASDCQSSGGVLTITGLSGTRKARINSIVQVKSRAEVVQVITVGATSYTPTANTAYTVEIGDTNRIKNGINETLKRYTYVTPPLVTTMGDTAALQREFITGKLVALINADTTTNYITAATLTLGNGFTVTDSAGYYPVPQQGMTNRLGASTVLPCTNPDGTGYLATNVTTTTAAVYSFGLGADLALWKPVIDQMWGNLISGYTGGVAPKTTAGVYATSGQNYDGFAVSELSPAAAHNQRGQVAFVTKIQTAYVDNGTGTSTANLAGFVAFEREFIRQIDSLNAMDPMTQSDFFDAGLVASATYPTTGLAVTTTDNVVMSAIGYRGQEWYINPIGAHTVITPIVSTAGLLASLDATTQEGLELSPSNLTQCPKQFVVGKTEASWYMRFNIGAGIGATDYKTMSFGFRKKAAYAVDQTAYEAASVATACLGVSLDTGVAPAYSIITGPGSAGALTVTSAAVTPAVSTAADFLVTVDINGVARFYLNGVDKTPLLAASYSFAAGTVLMPFFSFRHGAGAAAVPTIVQCMFLPTINWRG